jgi:hypothetical protein
VFELGAELSFLNHLWGISSSQRLFVMLSFTIDLIVILQQYLIWNYKNELNWNIGIFSYFNL